MSPIDDERDHRISVANICEVAANLPPRVLVHGQEGVGKTTLAAKFPKPVFLQTEDGTPAGLTMAGFGLLSSYADVTDALAALGNEPHEFQTVVIDSLDKLEGLIWADVCATNKWPSIETPGYGKGYVISDKWWRDILAGLDWLRRERGLTIVLLAHSAVEIVNDPRAPAYTSYQLRLHKRARGLVQDEMDAIFFLATDVRLAATRAGKYWIGSVPIELTWTDWGLAWFSCPRCSRRSRYLYLPEFACHICCKLDWSSRHQHRSIPGIMRLRWLRRRIGADERPFTPLPKRPRAHLRYHRIAAEIRDIELRLVEHLRSDINDVLRRRIKLRTPGKRRRLTDVGCNP